jgi:hypothetical protein
MIEVISTFKDWFFKTNPGFLVLIALLWFDNYQSRQEFRQQITEIKAQLAQVVTNTTVLWTIVDATIQSDQEEKVLKKAFKKNNLTFDEEWPDPMIIIRKQRDAGTRK